MGFPKGASIPFAILQLPAGFKPRSRIQLVALDSLRMYCFAMTVSARTGLKILLFLLAFVALVGLALAVIFQSGRFKDWLQAEVSQRSGYQVRLTSLGFRLPLTIVAAAVEVTKAPEFQFKTSRLTIILNPFDLLSKTLHRLEFDQPVLQLDVDEIIKAPTRGSTEFALRYLNIQEGRIVLKRGGETIFELPKINLQAQDLNLAGPSGISLSADVPQLNGAAELRIKGQPRDLESEITLRAKQSSGLFSGRNTKAPDELLHMRIKLRAPDQQKANATIESKFNQLEIGANKLTGTLDAQVVIDPGLTEANFFSKASVADFSKSFGAVPLKLPNGNLAVNLAGNYSVPNKVLVVKSLQMSAPFGNGVGAGQVLFGAAPRVAAARLILRDLPLEAFKANLPAPLNQWSYQGLGRLTLELQGAWDSLAVKGSVQSDSLQVRGDEIAVANLSVVAPFEWRKPALRFTETKLRGSKLTYAPKERWQAAVEKMQVESSFEYQAKQPLKVYGRIETAGAKFNSPDSSKVGENINLNGPFELTANTERQTTSIAGKFTAETGELLWGKFFGDLKSPRPVLELDADYLRSEDRLDCRRCSLHLANVGLIEVAGAIERVSEAPVLRIQASSRNLSPSGFFEFFLRETFNRQYPVLDKLAVAGQLDFRLQIDGKLNGKLDELSAAGELSLKGGELRAKSPKFPKFNDWQIGPIALNLPLQIQLAEAKPQSSGTPRAGTLTIEKIRWADQTIAPLKTSLSLSNNALRFHQPIHIGIFGGDLEISNILWPDLLRDPKQVSFSAETKRLKLEDLTQSMNWPRFSGTLTGSIPEVQSAENLLRTRGEIQAELFGGRIRMSKLEIENPFSALAAIKLDAKLTDIQLEQLTKTFAFGRISGILEGSIDNLVLTDGQPSELSADLRSVDRGGEQRISVEALNKITVLSSGADAGALYGGLASFFDSFRYSKLGFRAALKNDRLTLRGVETRGDQEFLVVGSFLPPTVNVVSHTQNIAFSELVRRLETINKTGKPNVK